jgi:hypothetical protein
MLGVYLSINRGKQMNKILCLIVVFCAVALGSCAPSLLGQSCKEMAFSNENQVETVLIKVGYLSGRVIDPNGEVIPKACVGIFTEADHKLLEYAQADDNGNFQLGDLPSGDYRMVGQSPGFCTANRRIRINSHSRNKKVLTLHLFPPLIHCPSYVDLSKK